MLARLIGTQFEVERALAAAAMSGADTSDLSARHSHLSELRLALSGASPADLPSLRQSITTALVGTTVAVQVAIGRDLRSSLTDDQRRAAETVQRLTSDYYEKRVLDPYLQFDTVKEEEAYRERERERRAAIDRENEKGTLQGQRNAARLMQDQLRDAGAHGAARSPLYHGMVKDLEESRAKLDAEPVRQSSIVRQTSDRPQTTDLDVDEAMAAFRAAGVEVTPETTSGHGISDRAQSQPAVSAGRV